MLVIVIFYALDQMALNGLNKLRDDDYKDLHLLFNNEIDDEVLIVGSSRAWNHFDVSEIQKITGISTRVVGLSGADFNMQRVLWEQALNNVSDTEYIVHVVGSLEFSKRTDGVFRKYKFYPFLNNQYVQSNLSKIQPDLWKDQYLPMYKFHGYYNYFLKGLKLNFVNPSYDEYYKYKGFTGFKNIWNGTITVESKVISDDDINKGMNFIEYEAKLAAEKEKQLILVYTPEHKVTDSLINGKNKIIERLNDLALNHSNMHFLDYSKWYGNDDISLFSNATHLNVKGAKLFSQTFAKDFLEILKNN